MIEALMAVLVAGAVLAIFVTMGPGQKLVTRLGLRRLQEGAAPDEDRAFLLQACGGDEAAVDARIDAVRLRYPEWTEAQLYRRAIRAVMNEGDEATQGDVEARAAERSASGRGSER